MAVQHMVWIKFKADITETCINEHLDGLRSLTAKVPGITALSAGKNFTDRANGFNHGLLVTLESRDALDAYQVHPEHIAVAVPLKADADLMAMDIES